MKRLLQFFTLLALALVGGAQTALAETITATLDHTAGSGWASAAAKGYTVDSESEYYNTDAATGWAGAAFAQFSFSIPEGQIVTSATLTWACTQYNASTYSTDINYLNKGVSVDFDNFISSAAGSALLYKDSRTWICTTDKLQGAKTTGKLHTGLTTDVTDAVKAIVEDGQSYIIFQWTGNSGSADLKGKGDTKNAPILVITTTDASSTTSYTVNFIDASNNVLKDPVVYEGQIVGTSVRASDADKVSFLSGEKKYILESGDEMIELVSDAASNVINLVFREAAQYSYIVNAINKDDNAVIENILAGSDFEGATIVVPYKKYLVKDNALYVSSKQGTNPWWKVSLTLTENNQTNKISYSKAEGYVVYLKEAEDIEGLTSFSDSNADIRCSDGMAAYNAGTEPVTITTLASGKYKLYTSVWGNAGATITFNANDVSVLAAETKGYIQDYNTDELNITDETVITVEGGSAGKGFDYVYIVRTGDATLSIDLPADYTYSTFCSTKALDFTDNADVEAYIAQVENDGVTVTLTKVNQVPAGEGVILKKTGDNTTAAVKVLASAEALSNNALVGVTEANTVSLETLAAAGNAYVLVSDEKFSKVSEGASGYISAGKAYLEYTPVAGASVNSLRISFGEPTAVADVEAKQETGDNAIYNVQGIRVSKPTAPGMYIMNGKAFIVK